ncbi:pentatricopeptide repeat-containing At3g05240 [Olea europaea subsp. europaea]|uniref:Pentatricopeptide repeat-containing At3g05240 n=1 Tax=Olea europaea subsp. europaea TaxID=158383 RepID=A0A8S0TVJ3_OLEEU|nr:pentatricopeptide repeat-containing At3g05240 [Olea europaea subsp. europaea]
MIRHTSNTNPLKALSLFQKMLFTSAKNSNEISHLQFHNDPFIYASVIKACNKAQVFREGKSIHCYIMKLGLDCNVNILNSLLSFYMGYVNLMNYAEILFDRMSERNVVTVNSMITGHVKRGNLEVGLSLLIKMLRGCFGTNVEPNYVSYVILISGSVDFGELSIGNALYCCCCKVGLDLNVEICNVLIDLYSKLGCIYDALRVFNNMPHKDLISWNTMLSMYANNGDCMEVLTLFKEMRSKKIEADGATFTSLVSACAASRYLKLGRLIHSHVITTGMEYDVSVGTALINMYTECREVESARNLFEELPKQNIASWNAMIHSYVEGGLPFEALKLFHRIKSRNVEPDQVTFVGLIMACRDSGDLDEGVRIHSYLGSNDQVKESIILGNALIDMYAKCGSMDRARAVFDTMLKRDVVSWTSIIVGHAINGEGKKSLAAFEQMCAEKIDPNPVTFIGVLSACDHAGLIDEGKHLFDIMRSVFNIEPRIEHLGCVVDMLARAGRIEEASRYLGEMTLESNTPVWRMLMNGCRINGNIGLGLNLVSCKTENKSQGSEDHVILSNVYAEAGKWDDVICCRSLMVVEKDQKVAGSSVYLQ